MALTKINIVESIQTEIGWKKNESIEIVESVLEIIKSTLEKEEDVLISRFGKFRVKKKNERRGWNFATGDGMMLRPRKVVTFKWAGNLRDKINGKG